MADRISARPSSFQHSHEKQRTHVNARKWNKDTHTHTPGKRKRLFWEVHIGKVIWRRISGDTQRKRERRGEPLFIIYTSTHTHTDGAWQSVGAKVVVDLKPITALHYLPPILFFFLAHAESRRQRKRWKKKKHGLIKEIYKSKNLKKKLRKKIVSRRFVILITLDCSFA